MKLHRTKRTYLFFLFPFFFNIYAASSPVPASTNFSDSIITDVPLKALSLKARLLQGLIRYLRWE